MHQPRLRSPPPLAAINRHRGAGAGVPTEFISFAIGDDQYGVDIMAVREIKGCRNRLQAARICAGRAQSPRRYRSDRRPAVPLRSGPDGGDAATHRDHRADWFAFCRLSPTGCSTSCRSSRRKFNPCRASPSMRVDFLSGLVTVDGAMLALIDLQNLLAVTMTEGEDLSAADRQSATGSQRN